jgi:hypothetical protein
VLDQEAVEDDLAAVVRDVDHVPEASLDLVAVVDGKIPVELLLEEGGEVLRDLVALDAVIEGVADDRGRHEGAEGREARPDPPARDKHGGGADNLDLSIGIRHAELVDGEAMELARDDWLRDGLVAELGEAFRAERRHAGGVAGTSGEDAAVGDP